MTGCSYLFIICMKSVSPTSEKNLRFRISNFQVHAPCTVNISFRNKKAISQKAQFKDVNKRTIEIQIPQRACILRLILVHNAYLK